MGKDPAFLFYSSDFLTGISDLTMEERGQFITLLCIQHQKGKLTKKTINISIPNISSDVLAKFKTDENGLFFNERLEVERENRLKHSEKQRQRAINGWKKRKEVQSHGIATALPLENENENIIEVDNIINIEFEIFWNTYDKKVGKKEKIEKKWIKLSDKDRVAVMDYILAYRKEQPDKQYRKNPETFLNNESWKDELIKSNNNEKSSTKIDYDKRSRQYEENIQAHLAQFED